MYGSVDIDYQYDKYVNLLSKMIISSSIIQLHNIIFKLIIYVK